MMGVSKGNLPVAASTIVKLNLINMKAKISHTTTSGFLKESSNEQYKPFFFFSLVTATSSEFESLLLLLEALFSGKQKAISFLKNM